MQTRLVIDMRCLQGEGLIARGIGVHAANIVRRMRDVSTLARNASITALTDSKAPPLPADLAALADHIRPNAYFTETDKPKIFVQLSPMTHPPLFTARILSRPDILKASIVYDFIPHDAPETYLTDTASRLLYQAQMIWLRRYDLYFPLSQATAQRLHSLLPMAGKQSLVTGAAINPALAGPQTAGEPRHILTISGEDPRKNPECAIRAHANSKAAQTARIPLILTGFYRDVRQNAFKALAKQCGGDPDLLHLPGHVSTTELQEIYRHVFCVVTPSRAEGFSLPVVEAMAAGVPSLVSDIPEHAELVTNPALRFAPDDDATLATLLDHVLANPERRAEIVAAQSSVWPTYTGDNVARRFWTAIDRATPAAPSITRARQPRIAFVTPMPPARSGVADYSAACVAALHRHAEVTVVTPELATTLPYLSPRFDRTISVMGNSPQHHRHILDLLENYGGACICHDARLLQLCFDRSGPEGTVAIAGTELHRTVSTAEINNWLRDETTREADFLGPVAKAATPLMLHTRFSVEQIRKRFGITAICLPFALQRAFLEPELSDIARRDSRSRLGFTDDTLHIVSFGFVTKEKGIDESIAALAALQARGVNAILHWVGSAGSSVASWQEIAKQSGVAHLVQFHNDYVSEARYRDFLRAADFGLQLRRGGRGNISGTLQDCINAGLPTVADADLAEWLDAPDYVARVETTGPAETIADAILTLQARGLHRQRDMNSRTAYCAAHSMELYAERLFAALNL